MALKAQNKLSPEWWSPTDAEDAPRYKLRPLNGMEYLDVAPGMSIDERGYIRYDGNAMKALVRYGLLDWEGIEDPDTGEPLEFGRDAVNRLPPLQLRQIAQEVANRTQLTEGEAKN